MNDDDSCFIDSFSSFFPVIGSKWVLVVGNSCVLFCFVCGSNYLVSLFYSKLLVSVYYVTSKQGAREKKLSSRKIESSCSRYKENLFCKFKSNNLKFMVIFRIFVKNYFYCLNCTFNVRYFFTHTMVHTSSIDFWKFKIVFTLSLSLLFKIGTEKKS